jgi:His/Glu/Gln/Arg/opine family amino acid ABC transporter permease subunit
MDSLLIDAIVHALLSGAVTTVKVAAGALAVALLIGLTLSAVAFLTSCSLVHLTVRIYVEALRNTPSLTFLFLLYFGLAAIGLRLSSMSAAILGLGLIGGAITVDIFRSSFHAVPSGQAEAGAAIGLTPFGTFRLIILPQGLRFALPSLGNYTIALIKDTSLVAAIAAPEILFNARQLVNETFETALVYGAAALLYLILTIAVAQVVSLVEQQLEVR